MKKIIITKVILTIIFTAILSQNINAQKPDLSEFLSKLVQDSVKKYAQVITNTASSDLNSGLFLVTKPTNKFSLYVGFEAIGSFLPADTKFPAPAANVSIIPLGMIHVSIGSILGTDFFGRFCPKFGIAGYGSVSAWGFGLQHDIAKDFKKKKMPFELTFQFSTHFLTLSDSKDNPVFNVGSWSASLMLSKRIKNVLTLYAIGQYEKTSTELTYNSTLPKLRAIDMFFYNDNNYRFVTGFNLKLGVFNLNADYNFSMQNSVSMGLGLGF